MRTWGLVRRVVGLLAVTVLVATVVASRPPSSVSAAGTGYVSLPSPARLLDTRPGGSTVDNQFAAAGIRPLASTLALTVAGRATIPVDAAAVVLNVTVTEATGNGFITVFPCGSAQPTASNLNYVVGVTAPNMVIAKVGTGGQVCLFNGAATHLIVDVAGYFPGTDALTPLTSPARLLDTRSDGVTVDGLAEGDGIRQAGTTQTLQVTGRAAVPAGAASVVLNVTVDQPAGAGFITVHPCDTPLPTASNVNFVAGQTIPNAVVAKLSAAGTVCLYTSATTHLVVDIAGYFVNTTVLVPLMAPARLLDTRSDGITFDGAFKATGRRPTGGTMQLTVTGRAAIPADASAVVLNVTVDQTEAPGFITVYPAGVGSRPNASNLNYVAGQTVPNAVIARLGSGGTICLFNSGATHLIVDVAGYLTGPAPAAAGQPCGAVDPVVPGASTTTTIVESEPPVPTTVPPTTSSTTTTTTSPPVPVDPNGKIAFTRANQIYTINPNGTGEVQLTTGDKNYWPRWSPDGQRIAYVKEVGTVRNFWVMNANGSNKTQVTYEGSVQYGAAWSPDGQWLAYGGASPNGGTVLKRIKSTAPFGTGEILIGFLFVGADPEEMAVLGTPEWSPDGVSIVFESVFSDSPDWYMGSYKVADQAFTAVLASGGACCGDGRVMHPAFSPNGAIFSYTDTVEGPTNAPAVRMFAWPTGAAPAFTSVAQDEQLVWAPSGTRVVLMNDAGGAPSIILANANGTGRTTLTGGYQPDWQRITP